MKTNFYLLAFTVFGLTACGDETSIDTLIRQKAYDGDISTVELKELQEKSNLVFHRIVWENYAQV